MLWALTPSSSVVERGGGMNLFCVRKIESREEDIAPMDNTELGIRTRLADSTVTSRKGLGYVRSISDIGPDTVRPTWHVESLENWEETWIWTHKMAILGP